MPTRWEKLVPGQEALRLRTRGVRVGTRVADGSPFYHLRKHLRTHVHCIGPTDMGKSRFLLWLFQLLCYTKRPIVLIDPKGGLYRMCRDWALSHGFTKRLVLFDLSGDVLPGYNPLRPNGLRIDLQAQWVREGVKSAWGSATFDSTPQLARILYLCLYVSRAMTVNLVEGLNVLRPQPALRRAALARIKDPFVHDALLAFDRLPERRKEELAASTLARLEGFCCDTLCRHVICSPQSIDLEEILTERKILLINFAKYQPLLPDSLKLLGRMLINDLLAHIYKLHGEGKLNEDRACYVVIDEVQNFATTQLCDALDEGRGVGCHTVIAHQFLGQLADEDQSGYLLRSVMTDARTKLIFGDLPPEDLEVLAKHVFLDRYDPRAIKHEIVTPIFAPVETTRVSRSWGKGASRGRSHARSQSETYGDSYASALGASQSETHGDSYARAHGVTASETQGFQSALSRTITEGTSRSVTEAQGVAVTQAESRGVAIGHGTSQSRSASSAAQDGWSESRGMSYPMDTADPSLGTMSLGSAAGGGMLYGTAEMEGASEVSIESRSTLRGTTEARSRAVQQGTSRSAALGESSGESVAHQRGTSETETWGENHAATTGTSETETWGENHAVTDGTTDTNSEEESAAYSETESPFHEYHREELTTPVFFTPEEQWLTFMQALQAIPKAHAVIKPPGGSAELLRLPWVDTPSITRRKLAEGLARVYGEPYYTQRIDLWEEAPVTPLSAPLGAPALPEPHPRAEAHTPARETPVRVVTPEVLPPTPDAAALDIDDDFLQ